MTHATLRSRGRWYWIQAIALIVGGMVLGDRIADWPPLVEQQYRLHSYQQRFIRPRPRAQHTVVVLIDDDDYWKGPLAGRVPIKRRYLAELLRALDAANAAVIALDFDFRSPAPDGSMREHPDYVTETQELLTTIQDVSARRAVVLSRTIEFDATDNYVTESDVFDAQSRLPKSVYRGYITLPYDMRRLPTALALTNGDTIDSFAQAIVRAWNAKALQALPDSVSFPFATFVRPDDFESIAARAALSASENARVVAHKIAIVGGIWHDSAHNRGFQTDSYLSPVGEVGGVFLHANYVEAILNQRWYQPLPE